MEQRYYRTMLPAQRRAPVYPSRRVNGAAILSHPLQFGARGGPVVIMDIFGKRVLVTGANGFIASHLVTRLLKEGAQVRGLVRRKEALRSSEIEYFLGDLTDAGVMAQAVAGCDIVVHTAALQPFKPLAPRAQFQAVNVGGTENLLRAFSPRGEGRFLLLGTINEHGMPPPPGVHADSPLVYSGDRYSDSKIDGERAAWQPARERGIPLTVVRPACTFGPRGTAWTLQPLERLRRGTPVLIGAGRGLCNPVYIDNLADLIVAALQNEAAVGQAFIGSDGVGVEWRDFFGYYARLLGRPVHSAPYLPARVLGYASSFYERATGKPGPVSSANVAFYSHRVTFDVSKNVQLLGHTPRVSFEEGMRQTAAWLREEKLL
jgi:nucleoside-diphosphate-sugar epimerase